MKELYSNAGGKFFAYFEEITRIPHGSGNTKPIADYLESFAKRRGLEVLRDGYDNVIIKKPATVGYEDRPTVILQGHTDMVLAKTKDVTRDLNVLGIEPYVNGDFLRAKGTTLGADDGIAVAYMLAILDSNDIPHPDLEAVFTSDEETGLIGATGLDASVLKGNIMINVDSDDEGVFTVSCAGGLRANVTLDIEREAFDAPKYILSVSGLTGGHSGVEIDKNRKNAIKAAAELASELGDIRIVSLCGGNADNAIPKDAEIVFASQKSLDTLKRRAEDFKKELTETEPCTNVSIERCDSDLLPASAECTKKILELLFVLPSGVIDMSRDIEGLVETSLNLGIAECKGDTLSLCFSLRSSVDSAKSALYEKLAAVSESYGAKTESSSPYPAWEYKKDSHLRDVMCEVFKRSYGYDAKVIAIHAGLECGIFAGKIKELDCVSIGPTSFDIHTPDERLSISSAIRTYAYIIEVLKNI